MGYESIISIYSKNVHSMKNNESEKYLINNLTYCNIQVSIPQKTFFWYLFEHPSIEMI